MKNIPNIYIFEYMIAFVTIYQYIQDLSSLMQDNFHPNVISSITTLSILIMVKIQREGTRAPFLFQIISVVSLYFTKINHYQTSLAVLTGVLLFIQMLLLSFFPSFKYPKTTGPYDVGYNHFRLDDHTMVSVYYPIKKNSRSRRPIYQMRDHSYIKLLFESTKVGWIRIKIPYFLFFLAKHFVMKIKVNAKLQVEIATDKINAILFSHGLGGHRDHYTGLSCEWASHGYTIFLPSHKEKIVPTSEDVAKFNLTKNDPLAIILFKYYNDAIAHRLSQLKLLINYITNQEKLKALFSKDVTIDWDQLTMAGHSYGAATAIELAQTENVIKRVIAFDPWFFPMDPHKLQISLNVPLLCVNSETFTKRSLGIFQVEEKIQTFFKSQDKNQFSTLIQINLCEHLHFSDYPFIAPRELQLVKFIQTFDKVTEFIAIINQICLIYLGGKFKNEDDILKQLDEKKKQITDRDDIYKKIY